MMNWLKNTISKLTSHRDSQNYVVAEYHASKKKRVKSDNPVEYDFETEKNSTGVYMSIDELHQKNWAW